MTDKPSTIVPKIILLFFGLGLAITAWGIKTTEEITTNWTLLGVPLMALSLMLLFSYEGLRKYYKTKYGLAALDTMFREFDESRERSRLAEEASTRPEVAPSPTPGPFGPFPNPNMGPQVAGAPGIPGPAMLPGQPFAAAGPETVSAEGPGVEGEIPKVPEPEEEEPEKETIQVIGEDELEDDASFQNIIEANF